MNNAETPQPKPKRSGLRFIFWFIILILIIISLTHKSEEELKQEAGIPTFVITSDLNTENHDPKEPYILTFDLLNAPDNSLEVAFKKRPDVCKNGKCRLEVDFTNPTRRVLLDASNRYNKGSDYVDLVRSVTPEEIEADKTKVAKEKAEQAAWDASEAGKLCKKADSYKRSQCKRAALGDVWIGMDFTILKAKRGLPSNVNKADYGSGTEWQWCWTGYATNCVYDKNNDLVIDAFN